MGVFAYKIDCLTNLHVGSGDLNYNIVDNEVERDAVTGYPVVHASGLKGALREHYSKKNDLQFNIIDVFGQEAGAAEIKAGDYKFLDAYLLARPMRVSGQLASIMVVSEKSVNDFIRRMNVLESRNTALNICVLIFRRMSILSQMSTIFALKRNPPEQFQLRL